MRAKDECRDSGRDEEQNEGDFHRRPIKRKEERTDELSAESDGAVFLLISRGDEDRRALLLEEGGDLVVGQRATELGDAVVDFGLQVGREFGGDVFALPLRQPEFHGGEIAIE